MTIPFRREKLSSQMVREVSSILQTKVKDPRMGFVSVTRVQVSSDFKHARVFISIMGDDREKKLTMDALRHAQGFIQFELSRRLTMRQVPEVAFVRDDSIDKAFQLTQTIEKLARERKAREKGEKLDSEDAASEEE